MAAFFYTMTTREFCTSDLLRPSVVKIMLNRSFSGHTESRRLEENSLFARDFSLLEQKIFTRAKLSTQ